MPTTEPVDAIREMEPAGTMSATARRPRRLPRDARRDQLVAEALPVLARDGLAGFSLDEVAARAGVTRNLIYHYFRRGRPDLVLAVVRLAEQRLAADWELDERRLRRDRVAANFERIMDHALKPTDAWRVHRISRAAVEPELRAAVDLYLERAVSTIATNQLGTADPPTLVRIALRGYIAFAETVLDEARTSRVPRARVLMVLHDVLAATVQAASAPR
jgi:AcrR family transcriptional regulator